MDNITYRPIGLVHSPFREPDGTPIQSAVAENVDATVELFPEFVPGLKDLEGFSHIFLIYHFHRSKGQLLEAEPYMDGTSRGVFAMRGPSRPNPIGISVVRLVSIEGNILRVRGVDILDGTPLLDIKPYVPEFDVRNVESIGWLEGKVQKLSETRDDGRFAR